MQGETIATTEYLFTNFALDVWLLWFRFRLGHFILRNHFNSVDDRLPVILFFFYCGKLNSRLFWIFSVFIYLFFFRMTFHLTFDIWQNIRCCVSAGCRLNGLSHVNWTQLCLLLRSHSKFVRQPSQWTPTLSDCSFSLRWHFFQSLAFRPTCDNRWLGTTTIVHFSRPISVWQSPRRLLPFSVGPIWCTSTLDYCIEPNCLWHGQSLCCTY